MIKKILMTVFVLFVFSILSYIAVETYINPTLMTTENRVLASFPPLPKNKNEAEKFIQGIESWWSDSIHFRQEFIQIFNRSRAYLGISPQKEVTVGKDGWLFFNAEGSLDDYRNARLFTEEEVGKWKNYLLFRHYDAKRRGALYIFFVSPNKERIYGEFLPDNITKLSDTTRFDQILQAMKDTPVKIIDLRQPLLEAKKNVLLYHKTDTHWNLIAAGIVQNIILGAIQERFPDLKFRIYSPDDFYFAEPGVFNEKGMPYAGGLTYALGIIDPYRDEKEPIFKQMPTSCIEKRNFPLHENYAIIPDAQRAQMFQAEGCNSGKYRVLMIRDSFADYLKPYFSSTFNYVFYFWMSRPNGLFDWNNWMDAVKPDIVLDETVERYLVDIPQPGSYYPAVFETE